MPSPRRANRALRFAAIASAAAACGCAVPTRIADVDPEVPRAATQGAIDATLDTVESPRTQKRLTEVLKSPEIQQAEREFVAGLVDGSIDALEDASRAERLHGVADDAIQSSLGTLREGVAPALAATLEDEALRRALGATARTMGREVVIGINEGMAEGEAQSQGDESTDLSSITELASRGSSLASWATGVLVVAVAALIVWIVVLSRRLRRDQHPPRHGYRSSAPRGRRLRPQWRSRLPETKAVRGVHGRNA